MKIPLLSFALIVLGASALQADSTNVFVDYRPLNPNHEVFQGMDVDISPYAGWVGDNVNGIEGNRAVLLFCEDYADDAAYYAGWAVNATPVSSLDFTSTRYGAENPNPMYATGSSLYRQLAWLFTQTLLPGQSTGNQDAIQEAAWVMTNGKDETPHLTATATGQDMSYLAWIAAAEASFERVATGYATPDYSQWAILTDVNAAGNTRGIGKQEFLAYLSGGGTWETAATSAVGDAPEPSAFVLAGAGLFALGLAHRRK